MADELLVKLAMNEMDAIIAAVDQLPRGEDAAVLATVVRVRGSAYRRPGARMLLLPDGTRVGSISGGCLESDLRRKAWWLTRSGEPALRTYDSRSEEDALREFGLGCNGVVDVLLERVSDRSVRATLEFLRKCRGSDSAGVIVHTIRTEGNGAGVNRHFEVSGDWDGDGSSFTEGHGAHVFREYVPVPVDLLIFGAGYDAVPVVQFAHTLGWRVTIADSRPAFVKSRFPAVSNVVSFQETAISSRSIVVLMTHNYPQDLELLRRVLPAQPKYLGVLGPRTRTDRLFRDLGLTSDWESLHAPVGLDIGAETPETIALSIVAEIQSVLSGRDGGMLRYRVGPINFPMTEFVRLNNAEAQKIVI